MLLGVENIDVNLKAGGGRSPLHMIAEKNPRYMEEGHLRAMSSLLRAHGININLKDKDGNTPLSRACVRANLEAVRVLLRAGADANIQNDFGSTALGIAKRKLSGFTGPQYVEIVRLLQQHGAVCRYSRYSMNDVC